MVPLTVLLGGARSGKSALAVRLARRAARPVVFVATGQAGDEEMADRIARHRAERPGTWTTVEEPLALEAALAAAPPEATVVVDCLTLWVANLAARLEGPAVLDRAAAAAAAAAGRPGPTLAVSNEVGSGLVPFDPALRAWRDLLGGVNARWVAAADAALLVVAGRALVLAPAEDLLDG